MNSWAWWAVLIVLLVLVGWFLFRRTRSSGADRPKAPSSAPGHPSFEYGLRSRLERLWSKHPGQESLWAAMEEELIAADVGVQAARSLVEAARRSEPGDAESIRQAMRSELNRSMSRFDRRLNLEGSPSIVVMVGVNGAGKTTTAAKLASRVQANGQTVLLGAADTFRPAADSQLKIWADQLSIPIVSGARGSDPASVAYDALLAARARSVDVLIVDTAGRLHTSHNLMEQLTKLLRVLERDGDQITEVLLVMDATTGQSGLAQAERFAGLGAGGVVLTKMDGTAKGGIVVAIEDGLQLPVKLVGVGEGPGDLVQFDVAAFVDALLS